jgi:hypothetical protein
MDAPGNPPRSERSREEVELSQTGVVLGQNEYRSARVTVAAWLWKNRWRAPTPMSQPTTVGLPNTIRSERPSVDEPQGSKETPMNTPRYATDIRSLRIIRFADGARFIPLPQELWRSAGRCDCSFCKGQEGFWDTLAVDEIGERTRTVHFPALQHLSEGNTWRDLRATGFVPNEEKPKSTDRERLIDALEVIRGTPAIRVFLTENDPKALAQIEAVLGPRTVRQTERRRKRFSYLLFEHQSTEDARSIGNELPEKRKEP